MSGREYFISGIDTGCGKTYITGLLAKHLLKNHKKVITTKLIQTGNESISEDIKEHRKLMGVDYFPEDRNFETCPYVLHYPASPHLAAGLENKIINITKIRQHLTKLLRRYDIVLSEGAGGLMVPISQNYLITDYLKKYNIPLILISSSKLGSINHTLLSIQACISLKLNLHTIIYNELPQSDKIIAEDTFQYLKEYLKLNLPKVKILHTDIFQYPTSTTEINQYLNDLL